MKKKFFLSLAAIMMMLPIIVLAAGSPDTSGVNIAPFNTGNTASPVNSVNGVFDIIRNIVIWIYRAFFVVAVIFILMAAYNFIQGGTNEKKIEIAKGQLKYAAISIVVALIASGLSFIIAQFLGSGGVY